jgi:hypothetical protein
MALFKRLPALRWLPPQDSQIIPAGAQAQHSALADDFKTLEDELIPHFRELNTEALRLQNQFRRDQVMFIFGGACATILGALQASLGSAPAIWTGIIQSVLAAALSAVALHAQITHAQERYFTDRHRAFSIQWTLCFRASGKTRFESSEPSSAAAEVKRSAPMCLAHEKEEFRTQLVL